MCKRVYVIMIRSKRKQSVSIIALFMPKQNVLGSLMILNLNSFSVLNEYVIYAGCYALFNVHKAR